MHAHDEQVDWRPDGQVTPGQLRREHLRLQLVVVLMVPVHAVLAGRAVEREIVREATDTTHLLKGHVAAAERALHLEHSERMPAAVGRESLDDSVWRGAHDAVREEPQAGRAHAHTLPVVLRVLHVRRDRVLLVNVAPLDRWALLTCPRRHCVRFLPHETHELIRVRRPVRFEGAVHEGRREAPDVSIEPDGVVLLACGGARYHLDHGTTQRGR